MKTIRKKDEDLAEMLAELKIGDCPIFDEVSTYEITKVPNGFIYKNEYVGMVFVPDAGQAGNELSIKGSVIKVEPKIVKKPLKQAVIK